MSSFINKEALLGAAATNRGKINTITIAVAFALSIMVIHNYRTCEDGKGYPTSHSMQKTFYALAIIILIACCLLFGYDLAIMAKIVK